VQHVDYHETTTFREVLPMSRRSFPRYGHHKATAQARVRIDGKDHYLGEYGSPESHRLYARLISEWQSRQECSAAR
jgi:hypothetical protein